MQDLGCDVCVSLPFSILGTRGSSPASTNYIHLTSFIEMKGDQSWPTRDLE